MDSRLAGKVAIVTGASRGIGRALALAFARAGARVTVAAKSETESPRLPGTIHSVAREIEEAGGEALAVRVDVREQATLMEMAERTRERFGRIDIFVHNAGALWWQDVADTPLQRFDLMLGVNVRGAFAGAQAVLPTMLAQGSGHIIVCSPPVELAALPHKTGYLISKFGMTMLALGLAEEVRDRGISVNALWPATLIKSQATINFKIGGPEVWREPDIVTDAALEIVTTPGVELTGRAIIDEDFLRERGWTDFSKYRCDPEHEPPRVMDVPKVGRAPRE
jgi:citronellol/citronellal dehydrogenase